MEAPCWGRPRHVSVPVPRPRQGVVIVVSSSYSPADLEWHDAAVATAAAAWLAQPWDAAAYRHLVEGDARRRREGPARAGRSYTPVDVEWHDHAVTGGGRCMVERTT